MCCLCCYNYDVVTFLRPEVRLELISIWKNIFTILGMEFVLYIMLGFFLLADRKPLNTEHVYPLSIIWYCGFFCAK